MSLELTITAKNQVTLRKSVLEHLGVRPCEKIGVSLLPDGRVELTAATGHTLASLRGALQRPGQRTVSLQDMQAAIEAGAQDG